MQVDPSAEPELAAPPPVVAVMVTRDPGEWFDSALAALSAQDYDNLSILVIDAASNEDPTGRVAAVAPEAFVRRLSDDPGWASASNEALDMVQGSSYLLFCHDDAAPAPDSVRLLVEEAYRSNAGIVGPKLVDWDEHERIVSAGITIDKTGVIAQLVDPGELDQEQHDAVRDVFAVDGAFLLVRTDLATSLRGFDPKLSPHGEDVDFCWRAQIAGARVLVAPAARVAHRGATLGGFRAGLSDENADRKDVARHRDEVRASEVRHRVRMVLTNYSAVHLLRVVPQLLLVQVAELVYSLLAGRRRVAASVVGGWGDVLPRFVVRARSSPRAGGDSAAPRQRSPSSSGPRVRAPQPIRPRSASRRGPRPRVRRIGRGPAARGGRFTDRACCLGCPPGRAPCRYARTAHRDPSCGRTVR